MFPISATSIIKTNKRNKVRRNVFDPDKFIRNMAQLGLGADLFDRMSVAAENTVLVTKVRVPSSEMTSLPTHALNGDFL